MIGGGQKWRAARTNEALRSPISKDVPFADLERVGPIFVLRKDPAKPIGLIEFEQDDFVEPSTRTGCARR